jgi:ribosome-binding protein aMBF1 (putative translation factor)
MEPRPLHQIITDGREAAGLSLARLADAIERTESSVRGYERGTMIPPVSVLMALADVLELDRADLADAAMDATARRAHSASDPL